MSKRTRRAGRKTQLRRIYAQQFQAPRGPSLFGIENFNVLCVTKLHHVEYRLIHIAFVFIDSETIPKEDEIPLRRDRYLLRNKIGAFPLVIPPFLGGSVMAATECGRHKCRS